MRNPARPETVVVLVQYDANSEVGMRVVDLGLHALAEAIIPKPSKRGLKVEVAEKCYRRPIEGLKGLPIQAGIFGWAGSACSNLMGHGYLEVRLIRSYPCLHARITAVCAVAGTFSVAPHHACMDRSFGPRRGRQQHVILRLEDGRLGCLNWPDIAYDSPLRWVCPTKFFDQEGMAVGDRMTLLSKDERDTLPIEVERRFHNVGGNGAGH